MSEQMLVGDTDGSTRIPDMATVDTASEFQTLHEIVEAASRKLDLVNWDYLTGGSDTETTIRRNRLALDTIGFRPRILRNVASVDTSSEFFGQKVRMPVFLCPVGSLASFHESGATAVAGAAGAFGIPVFVSSSIRTSMEAVAAAAPELKVFQLYARGERDWVDDYVIQAKELGYRQLCVTVDNPVGSRRERDISKRFVKPWHAGRKAAHNASLGWDDLKRLKDVHKMPMILKGVGTGEDADLACRIGIDVVHISNHGGRSLDHCRGTTDVLPEVLEAVNGRAAVTIDGGFSRGSDVVKAIAMGAKSVGIGRLYLYGLAADGKRGVTRVLELLQKEIEICLALLGARSISELGPSHLHPAAPVNPPHLHSAFPLLNISPELRR